LATYDTILPRILFNYSTGQVFMRLCGQVHASQQTGCVGEIKANDILKLGNVIKNNISVPAKEDKIKFIQTKGDLKYSVVLKPQKDTPFFVYTDFTAPQLLQLYVLSFDILLIILYYLFSFQVKS
jgi:hypothetical protein